MLQLQDKMALVTGASRGIGKAIAITLGQQGAYVVGTATSQAGADAISAELERQHIQGCGLVLDVTEQQSVVNLFDELKNKFSLPDILVNNAAVTQDNLLLRMQESQWETVIDTNLNAMFRLCKASLKGMMKARWGRIINISSVVGLTGNPGQTNYAAAKAGVVGFSKSLAQEIAPRNITVNVIAPGFVATDMTQKLNEEQQQRILDIIPLGRVANPDEIAAAVAFLASPAAGYITGETLHINGGMYMG